ncbi:putative Transcription initiation factor [Fasciola gigantica]|uniref:Putative Transcription initiation factor n=1 Tax=Fasciola gigantica TaxID=46835 RepID=A0A504YCQ9_FASGI|nr:putative Transcription initiation factor [Fasciola gigantica]
MVNPVYLLPKSGLPAQPNVMQIRTLTATGTVSQTNGLVTNASILPRTASTQAMTASNSGAAKLVEFLNQLLELSKTSDSHSSVVRLIQALVNADLDASAFCDQLRVILKSANTSMDIAPFIKDNIDALRRDLANGVCRLSNIQPPSAMKISMPSNSMAPILGVAVSGSPGSVSVQVRPNVSVSGLSTAIAPRLGIPTISQPRIVGTLMGSTQSPVTIGQMTPVVLPSGTRPSITQPPLLAPAPPRTSVSASSTITNTTLAASLPKYRLTQPLNSVIAPQTVAAILPATSTNSVVSTRLTNTNSTLRANYPNLRPVLAPSPVSSASNTPTATGSLNQSLKSSSTVSIPTIVRAKPDASNRTGTYQTSTLAVSRTPSQFMSAVTSATGTPSLSTSNTPSSTTAGSGLLLLNSVDKKSDMSEISRFRSISPSRDKPFFPPEQIRQVLTTHGFTNLNDDAVICLAHGMQSFMRTLLTRLSVIVSHRLERLADDPRLTQTDNVREQLQFLQKLDERDMMRQSELEKDLILKAAKSRSRNEDPDQIRMREMARRIATEDYEREKQHQANLTALSAIGPQRKRRLDTMDDPGSALLSDSGTGLLDPRDALGNTGSGHSRLSLVSASRLSLLSSGQSGPGGNLTQSSGLDSGQTGIFPTSGNPSAGEVGLPGASALSATSSSFSLTHSSRVHRANLKDIQLVLFRTPRLRRTRTFYRTHWRS